MGDPAHLGPAGGAVGPDAGGRGGGGVHGAGGAGDGAAPGDGGAAGAVLHVAGAGGGGPSEGRGNRVVRSRLISIRFIK